MVKSTENYGVTLKGLARCPDSTAMATQDKEAMDASRDYVQDDRTHFFHSCKTWLKVAP